MKQWASVEIRGKHKRWSFPIKVDEAGMAALLADGLKVARVYNTVPVWVRNIGLTRLWCSVQDAWNFLRFW